jgi:predicted nucleotidyltransferase
MHEHSDLDVLVVVPDGVPQREGWERAHASLRRFGMAIDLLVVNESVLLRHAASPGLVFERALHDGKELYRAA